MPRPTEDRPTEDRPAQSCNTSKLLGPVIPTEESFGSTRAAYAMEHKTFVTNEVSGFEVQTTQWLTDDLSPMEPGKVCMDEQSRRLVLLNKPLYSEDELEGLDEMQWSVTGILTGAQYTMDESRLWDSPVYNEMETIV